MHCSFDLEDDLAQLSRKRLKMSTNAESPSCLNLGRRTFYREWIATTHEFISSTFIMSRVFKHLYNMKAFFNLLEWWILGNFAGWSSLLAEGLWTT